MTLAPFPQLKPSIRDHIMRRAYPWWHPEMTSRTPIVSRWLLGQALLKLNLAREAQP